MDPVIQGPWAAGNGGEGGPLRSDAGGFVLEVPTGALSQPTRMQVDLPTANNPSDLLANDLIPDGLTFQRSDTSTLPYQ